MINGVLGEGHVKLWARSPHYDVYLGWVLMITSCVPSGLSFFSPYAFHARSKEM